MSGSKRSFEQSINKQAHHTTAAVLLPCLALPYFADPYLLPLRMYLSVVQKGDV